MTRIGFRPYSLHAVDDPLGLLRDHAGRVDLVHLKDYDARRASSRWVPAIPTSRRRPRPSANATSSG